MRTTLLRTCALAFAVAANAQVAPTATLLGAQAFTVNTVAPALASTDVWPGPSRSAIGATGAAWFDVEHVLDDSTLDLRWQLGAQAVQGGATAAVLEVRYMFTSAVPQSGDLVITWGEQLVGTGLASLAVDVHDDGFVDAAGSFTTPIAFGAAPLVLRVRAEVSADAGALQGPFGSSWSWSGSALADLRVRFVPTHATAAVDAPQPCAVGPGLVVAPNLIGGVDLVATPVVGDDVVVFALGFQGADVALPWSAGCRLLVDPVVTPARVIVAGTAPKVAIAVPAAVRPAGFVAQAVTVDLDAVRLSAGARMSVAAY